MASLRIAGFAGPTDPLVIQINAKAEAAIQEIVDETNAQLPAGATLFAVDTYIFDRLTKVVDAWLAGRVEVKSRQIKLGYEAADDATQASIRTLLGL